MIETLPSLWIVIAAFVAAGFVKGVAGVGLPMTAMGILTFFIDPRTAFALVFVSIILTNLFQLYRAGDVLAAATRYLPFIICMCIGIPTVLTLTSDAPDRVLLLSLGFVVLAFVILNLSIEVPELPARHDRTAQIAFGSAAGVLGGLTSLWLPAIVIFLTAKRTQKEEFIRATALLLLIGSVPLCVVYIREGFLTGPLAMMSAGLLVPTMLGLLIGERFRNRLSEKAFRNATLILFFLVGLNLLRRGILG